MSNFFNMNFSGGNKWSEGHWCWLTTINDEILYDNLDLLIVPQYGRNPDYSG